MQPGTSLDVVLMVDLFQLLQQAIMMFVSADYSKRLTLLYLCNDIVQTCKRKHAVMYKDAFKEVLRDVALLIR